MHAIDALRRRLPESAKDLRLDLGAVPQASDSLTPAQRRSRALAVGHAGPVRAPAEDARAAATSKALNSAEDRCRHRSGQPAYAQKPARLRRTRLAQPASNKLDFELFALAVSAFNDGETCIHAHERAVLGGGLAEEHVHDAVRIAAVVAATAIALDFVPVRSAPGAGRIA